MANLAIEFVQYFEKANMWVGPREADLIHLGAKYSPCMRRDKNVEDALLEDKMLENKTACCIRNDGSGCMQSTKSDCSVCHFYCALTIYMSVNLYTVIV